MKHTGLALMLLKLGTGCVGSGSLGRDCGPHQYQTLSVTGPGQPVWSSLDVTSANPWL